MLLRLFTLVKDWQNTPEEMCLSRRLRLSCDSDDRATRPVLAEQVGGAARCCDDHDAGSETLSGCFHGGDSHGVSGLDWWLYLEYVTINIFFLEPSATASASHTQGTVFILFLQKLLHYSIFFNINNRSRNPFKPSWDWSFRFFIIFQIFTDQTICKKN